MNDPWVNSKYSALAAADMESIHAEGRLSIEVSLLALDRPVVIILL